MKTKLNPYLNFDGNCEEAFNYYKQVFNAEFTGYGMSHFRDIPGMEQLSEAEGNRVMHVGIKVGDQMLMGSDTLPSMGPPFVAGNNAYVSIHPVSREEADRIFNMLADGGQVEMPMADQFWGDYYGSLRDRFGISWMINYNKDYLG